MDMPSRDLMTWISGQKRWTKMYRGQRFYISARQLGCPETKEGSLLAANEWWRNKQAELDLAYRANLQLPRTPRPMEDIGSALLGQSGAWPAVLQAFMENFREVTAGIGPRGELPAVKIDEETAAAVLKQAVRGLLEKVIVEGQAIPEQAAELLPPARVHQIKSAAKLLRGESAAEPNRTVQALVDKWITGQRSLVTIGELTAARLAIAQLHLKTFAAFLGESADVKTIDEERLSGFFNFCLSKLAERQQDSKAGWSVAYAREVFASARAWIRWLWEQGVIDLPRNLNSRGWRFGSAVKPVKTWTADEVRYVIDKATGKLKLALLLMLNCGMTQGDCSNLRDDEVDWHAGRVIRKRSKTAKHSGVPTVDYPLWPRTFALLKQYRSGTDRVLLTETGKPFVRKLLVDGKTSATDVFASNYDVLKKKIGFKKPLKLLRKTSASLLESHPTYGRLVGLFLGHAPATMREKHYAAPPQALFDEAVKWLGEQLGVAELPADE
jgi:integrase